MNSRDRSLGMDRSITRRDLLHGVGALAAGSLVAGHALADAMLAMESRSSGVYPPALTGLRGNHAGSFEVAHQLAREGLHDWGPFELADDGVYDLVVVGAGISGLAAAHFYRKRYVDARILILDNHDDFGGHAKRNEFSVNDRSLIGYGGSQTFEEPSRYPAVARELLADLDIDLDRFYSAYDRGFFRRHGLAGGTFFCRDRWGSDRLVHCDLGGLRYTLPLAQASISVEEAVQQMPISEAARRQMLQLLNADDYRFADRSPDETRELLESISYHEFLRRHMSISEPDVFAALQDLTTDLGADIAAVTALDAIVYVGLPGAAAAGLTDGEEFEPYIHHFPDGIASIARMLVRQMIPAVAPGSTMEDAVTARFDYSRLDLRDAPVRMRLNSTVVRARHEGDPSSAKTVQLDYVQAGRACRVRGRHCVLACYNRIIPYLCDEMPASQRKALSSLLKLPVLYTNVALDNWRAFKKLGIAAVSAPGSYHVSSMLDFPVSLGSYEFSDSPDDPIVVHMERFPHRPNEGLTLREQAPLGRHELLSTPFETIERKVREQMAAMLADGGFDPARDIAGITVNRWPHGYAERDWLEDPWFEDEDDRRYPFVRGRQPFGRIVIANSDAAADANFAAAVEQAHRAVGEL